MTAFLDALAATLPICGSSPTRPIGSPIKSALDPLGILNPGKVA